LFIVDEILIFIFFVRNLFFFLCTFLREIFLVFVVAGVKMGLEVSEFDSYCCEESTVGIDLRKVVCECKNSEFCVLGIPGVS
jgi:hypothetical protein